MLSRQEAAQTVYAPTIYLFPNITNMITEQNFKPLLTLLGFEENKNIFIKKFAGSDVFLKVDFSKKELIYPEFLGMIINERQTCNFSSAENFVVFECVHRLLEKGYLPQHIELEPKWKLGHGASGGRADILVKNQEGKPLLLIECKTAGNEFNKAWKYMLQDGGQLFTYAQQIPDTEFLCLYASDFDEKTDEISLSHYIISHKDNPKILEENKDLLSFEKAKDLKQRFKVWKETYQLEKTTKGIFEDNIPAYQIGKNKYTIEDLQNVTEKDVSTKEEGKYHKFRTILRKHNVSGRENAFDVLVNLFLCKIVDETQNPQELKFYWKGIAYDNYFDFIDRLQGLYKYGMEKYLGEEITYISNDEIESAFWAIKQKRNATKKQIKDYFRQLKFFTNNDFAFIDVYNKKLFDKNIRILIEIAELWQDLRLKTTTQNQFLGDMFEYFLDNGIKQSEGQFFTPIPITRFICMALPLEEVVEKHPEMPKAIDYACGSGHFLTEIAAQTKPFIEKYKETEPSNFYRNIFGIEKESRLSKVAKISAYMYGQGEINVFAHDALDELPQIKEQSFDILVANPPFAVEDFLETLPEEQREKYSLLQTVSDLGNKNIQCFFLERAKQLLAPKGVAGIIVPSSVLSNSDQTHVATREILLKYFDFVSIVELGSNTFSKTGTNTVVLFLRRKAQKPEQAEQFENRVLDFFENWEDELKTGGGAYLDIDIVKYYCKHIEVPFETYQLILTEKLDKSLWEYDIFKEYKADFEKSTEVLNLKKKNSFKKLSPKEQQTELDKKLLEKIRQIEQDKLYYFMLAYHNPQKVLIVKSPTDNKEQKQFLGYEWSNAKGSEGLKYNTDATGTHQTPLFNPKDRNDPNKISHWIAQNFLDTEKNYQVSENLMTWVSYAKLTDLLDFSRKDFNKAFSLTLKKKIDIESKWDLVRIENILQKIEGSIAKVPDNEIKEIGKYPVVTQEKDKVISGYTDVENPITDLPLTVFGDHSCTFKYIDFPFLRGADGTQLLKVDTKQFIPKCFFYLVQLVEIANSDKYERHFKYLQTAKIPLPPLSVQEKIVLECEAIDQATEAAKNEVEKAKGEIENLVLETFGKYPEKKISEIAFINPSKSEIKNVDENILVSFIEMASVSDEGFIANKIDKPLKDLKKGSYTYFAENDIIIAKITPCMENGKCALAKGLTNGLAMGSSEFHVFRVKKNINNQFLFAFLNRELVRKEAEQNFTGSSGHRRVPASFYENYKIPVPPLEIQAQLVSEIEILESQIAKNEGIIQNSAAEKQAVLKKYL
ncbi:N-6 DNA methylase [Hugenholtzia roseola]|uniref:N-6 DNA methylase n=1 Tax=Hugenholtzia roseola TaxID=1002 RepID=UPI00068633FE|nr:N-6 DNA methylase [Hugenholtzia roseola]